MNTFSIFLDAILGGTIAFIVIVAAVMFIENT